MIAYREGSVPEVIDPGVTGFVIANIDEAVDAIAKIQYLDRKRCRERFEQRFSSARMAAEYVNVYEGLVRRKKLPRQPSRSNVDGTTERVPFAALGKSSSS